MLEMRKVGAVWGRQVHVAAEIDGNKSRLLLRLLWTTRTESREQGCGCLRVWSRSCRDNGVRGQALSSHARSLSVCAGIACFIKECTETAAAKLTGGCGSGRGRPWRALRGRRTAGTGALCVFVHSVGPRASSRHLARVRSSQLFRECFHAGNTTECAGGALLGSLVALLPTLHRCRRVGCGCWLQALCLAQAGPSQVPKDDASAAGCLRSIFYPDPEMKSDLISPFRSIPSCRRNLDT